MAACPVAPAQSGWYHEAERREILMPEQLKTLYKLMTMYTLSRVDFALTNSQITNVFLDLGYTNYFNVQYTLGDLVSSRLVHEEIYPDYRYYVLTDEGRESIEALKSSLAASIRSDIDEYLRENRLEFRHILIVDAGAVPRSSSGRCHRE